MRDATPPPVATVITRPEEAVAILAACWLDLGGRDLALMVARGEMCDRCARKALTVLGLAGGIGPVTFARHPRDEYGGVVGELRDRIADLLALDDEVAP